MANGLIDQAPASTAPGRLGVGDGTAQPGVAYDGQNAQVQQQRSLQTMVAMAGAKRGAHWFYWIAGLSLVNTIVALGGGQFHFVLGLGITEIADASQSPQARMIGCAIDLLVLGFFVMCGYFAGKLQKWAFVMGMAFYLLDGGITLIGQDWIGVAFHVFVLIYIWKGFSQVNAARTASEIAVLSGS